MSEFKESELHLYEVGGKCKLECQYWISYVTPNMMNKMFGKIMELSLKGYNTDDTVEFLKKLTFRSLTYMILTISNNWARNILHTMTSNIFVMRQPLTCQVLNLKQSTAEYLEQMRLHCKENEYNILDFFNEDKEEKFGCVPGKNFFWLIFKIKDLRTQ